MQISQLRIKIRPKFGESQTKIKQTTKMNQPNFLLEVPTIISINSLRSLGRKSIKKNEIK